MTVLVEFTKNHIGAHAVILEEVKSIVTTCNYYTLVFYNGEFVRFAKNDVIDITERKY